MYLASLIHAQAMMKLLPSQCHPDDIPDFKIDTARLTINNDGRLLTIVVLATQSQECHEVHDYVWLLG